MNKFILIGNLTKEPQINVYGDMKIASLRLAVPRTYKNKDGSYDTNFFDIKCFGKTAEICEKFCTKGTKIAVSGEIRQSDYEKDGKKIPKIELICNDFELLSSAQKKTEPAQANTDKKLEPIDDLFELTPIDDENDLPF